MSGDGEFSYYGPKTKDGRRAIAKDTMECLEKGVCGGFKLTDASALSEVWAGSPVLKVPVDPEAAAKSVIEVKVGTTLFHAEAESQKAKGPLGILNFASAKNPGGGFHNGANAQEESLARSSGLYPCLAKFENEMYAVNWKCGTGAYTDTMIVSPGVEVFKRDDGSPIKPYSATFVSAPAPNNGVLTRKRGASSRSASAVNAILKERIRRILVHFRNHSCHTLILGAWGCGVFGNNPHIVASIFSQQLRQIPFPHVVFAITDPSLAKIFSAVFEPKKS